MKRRAPIDTGGGRATGETDLQVARQLISKAGVLGVLTPLLETGVGRPRTLPLEALLVAAQLNALHRHHQGHLVEIARTLNAMTPDQLASLGVSEWDQAEAYDRVERLFVSLCKILEERAVVDGVEVDAAWFAKQIMAAAVPAKFRRSSSVAVDGTDLETWGALHGDSSTVELDGDAAATQLVEDRRSARRYERPGFSVSEATDASSTPSIRTLGRGTDPPRTVDMRGRTSATSCTWPCRPGTFGGQTGSTAHPSDRRWRAS